MLSKVLPKIGPGILNTGGDHSPAVAFCGGANQLRQKPGHHGGSLYVGDQAGGFGTVQGDQIEEDGGGQVGLVLDGDAVGALV